MQIPTEPELVSNGSDRFSGVNEGKALPSRSQITITSDSCRRRFASEIVAMIS